jgi:hypothetical protein
MKEWDVPRSELANAVRNANKIKSQRRQTITNLKAEKTEEALENFGRKLKKTFTFKKGLSEAEINGMLDQNNQAQGGSGTKQSIDKTTHISPVGGGSDSDDWHIGGDSDSSEEVPVPESPKARPKARPVIHEVHEEEFAC